jgi:hypothetical protein
MGAMAGGEAFRGQRRGTTEVGAWLRKVVLTATDRGTLIAVAAWYVSFLRNL